MAAIGCNEGVRISLSVTNFPSISRHHNFPRRRWHPHSGLLIFRGHEVYGQRFIRAEIGQGRAAVTTSLRSSLLVDDEKPYLVLPGGKISYLDEQDVVTFLDPPNELIPLDPSSYNPAGYLWKKIADIPAWRRYRLLALLKPRLISRVWEVAGTRYDDPKLEKKSASNLLTNEAGEKSLEFWNCRTSGGPIPIAWMNFFKKALFRHKNGEACGRIIDGSLLAEVSNTYFPLYFVVRQLNEVMATEQPCDLAYEFGNGLLDDYPQGFPKPAKHPWPFNDQVLIYVRHVGPGVSVGQAWQEGLVLEQVPRKLCNEILMVKDYVSLSES